MNILIIAAHPDDEILGVGGVGARHAANGDNVSALIVAEGATSRAGGSSDDIEALKNAAQEAAQIIGAAPPVFLGLSDNRLDQMDLLDVVQLIEGHARENSPEIVYTHHGGDLNLDHTIVHRSVVTACRPLPGSSVKKIYGFETLSSTEWSTPAIGPRFNPNHFVDISGTLEQKLIALDAYKSEMRLFPHPRSVEAVKHLAGLRGSQAGLNAAEAFEVILDING